MTAHPPAPRSGSTENIPASTVSGIQANSRTGTRGQIFAWCLWDTGTSAYSAVMLTFVFTVYLTSSSFGTPEYTSQVLSVGMTVAGFLIAATAPLIGQHSDEPASRARFLTLNTLLLALFTAVAFFAAPDPAYLIFGVALVAAGSVVSEFAQVSYNAMLPSLAGPERIGRISGWGWGAGYIGGIFALALVLFGFVTPGFFGVPEHDALNYRAVALFSAAWILLFSIPLMRSARGFPFRERQVPKTRSVGRGPVAAYMELFRTIRDLWRSSRATVIFLFSSAVFRDGLAGIFTFGGPIAAGSFGFSMSEVIIFAIAANLIAAFGAMVGGRLDDSIGPRAVILGSLVGVMVAGIVLLVWDGKAAFWTCGLFLCMFVGPAQASSRSYLGRLIPPGLEGEIYGLYATTGRAVSFLAPLLFGIFVTIMGAQLWGIIGILIVVFVGLILLLLTPKPPQGLNAAAV